MNNKYFSVYEVNSYIRELFEYDLELNNIYISGELSNFTHHSSGHMYFTLKDDKAKLSCVMFKTDATSLKFKPQNGQKVLVRGRVSVYERDGKYQLYCKSMNVDGIGDLYEAYQQLKKKLETEGLFDVARKQSLPLFPQKIGVVTSPTGAVIRDIINVSTKRYKGVNILLYPATVQGEGAHKTIIEGINYFNSRGDVDVIIIGRGGGSIEELWCFNEEELARCIYSSKTPIVSAVGHETDYTIADFVADFRASTPSHAAEVTVPSYDEISYKINAIVSRIHTITKNSIKQKRNNNLSYEKTINMLSPERKLKENMQYVDTIYNKIFNSFYDNIKSSRNDINLYQKDISINIEKLINAKKQKYIELISKIDVLSPLNTLQRGYSFVTLNDKVVNTVQDVEKGDSIKINMIDGMVNCKVEKIMEGTKWQLEKKKKTSKKQ
ncbi:MAG: exodeoxyribonuclease VII large subunit [Clostridium sp.]|uniref:exodeoxyribonuclease VII large subunit n=1 Tax=Clostridium sp. TaxID=1506 RepID=UPI002FCC31E7